MHTRLTGFAVTLLGLLAAGAVSLAFAVPATAGVPNTTGVVTSAPAPGSLDPTFGSGGVSTVTLGSWAGAAAVVIQPDGKIVTAGQSNIGGHNMMLSTRMTTSGQLDPTYGTGGIVTVNINGNAGIDSGAALALQGDGKIVMVGSGEQTIYGPLQFAAVRLLPNGARDQSFGNGGIAIAPVGQTAIATAVVIQPDGKLVLAGTAYVGHNEFAAARLNPNGSVDTTFGTNGSVTLSPTGGAWGMALQQDGKLLLAGQANYGSSYQQFMAARLNPNGTLDTGFATGGIDMIPVGVTSLGFGVALQTDGKAVLAGIAFTTTGVNATVRLNTNGTLDATYGSRGIATIPDWYGANGIILDSAGRAVLPAVGASAVVFSPTGAPLSSFGTGGIAMANNPTGGANGAAIQSDGKIVLAGAATVGGQTVLSVIRLAGISTQSTTPPPSGTPVKAKAATAAASAQASHRNAWLHLRHSQKHASLPVPGYMRSSWHIRPL